MSLRVLIAISSVIFIHIESKAQYFLKGGELNFVRGTLYQYKAEAKLLVQWPGTIIKPYININWGDGSPKDSIPFKYSTCTEDSASILFYSGKHTYAANDTYTASVVDSFFIPGIVNIPNSTAKKLHLYQEFTTTMWDSPVEFYNCLSGGVGCHAPDIYYSAAAHDIDGDSIGYSIAPNNDIPGYSVPQATVGTNGLVSFSTNVPVGYYNVRLKVDEWRKQNVNGPYAIIGSSYRDLIFKVYCGPVGINENLNNENFLSLFPNPVAHKLIVNVSSGSKIPIVIYDNIGRGVYTSQILPGQNQLDLDFLDPGIYYLQGSSEIQFKALKIVIE